MRENQLIEEELAIRLDRLTQQPGKQIPAVLVILTFWLAQGKTKSVRLNTLARRE